MQGATLERHAVHYARLVDLYGPQLQSAARPRVMPILDAEHDNIRAALDWSRATPHGTPALYSLSTVPSISR